MSESRKYRVLPLLLASARLTRIVDWRMQLNNFLQSNGGTRMLTWEVYSSGPPHAVVWTAITYGELSPIRRRRETK